MFEEYPTASKWFNGFFITIGVICVLGVILCIIYHPKFCREAEELRAKEKQLEQEIERQ
ncbi:hypothetical protein [endosymbiont GvMRE of Glomus versiforme]|nr:hypothetical protein [endosymbiont GvMRE of Glomus versiforme]RHZ36382.1 hypothetical protein GvMRE_Ic1g215 [endosymbiont GvMRE of Glomus versiforme]